MKDDNIIRLKFNPLIVRLRGMGKCSRHLETAVRLNLQAPENAREPGIDRAPELPAP